MKVDVTTELLDNSTPWTIRTALEWTLGYLESKGDDNPRLSAQWLLCAATGLSRLEININHDQLLADRQLTVLREGIKRCLNKEPLQYILGKTPFRHLEIITRQGVLIPRPETEVLVEQAILFLRQRGDLENAHVVDIGTGSGCVALSLLQECPGLFIVATDNDPQAVMLARENANALGLAVDRHLRIIEDDLADSLISNPEMNGCFDAVVSNPPYVPTGELVKLSKEIANFEPMQALDGGVDGLVVFKRIVKQAKMLLKPSGLLACELYETKLDIAREYCMNEGFIDVSIHADLAGRPRIITAYNTPCALHSSL